MDDRRHMKARWLGGLLTLTLGWPLMATTSAAPAAADCGSDGLQWPKTADEVQGLTFTGIVTALDESSRSQPRVTFRVDRVLDGPVGSTIVLSPWCVGTRFVLGQRYLVSTSDTLPLPGSEAASPTLDDREAWFTDPTAVAWLVQGVDLVRLMGYAEGPADGPPPWLEGPRTLTDAVHAVLPDGDGVVHERLGTRLSDDGTVRTELLRSTLPVGAALPPTRFGGDWLIRAEQGVLTVTLDDGSAVIGEVEGITLRPGEAFNLGEDRVLLAGPDAVMRWANRDDEPVVLLATASIPGDRPTMTVVTGEPTDPAATGRVLGRHVIRGTSETGDRSRITVLDRSGRVIAARVPSERELRFAGLGWPSPDGMVTLGPVVSIGGDRSEMLIRSGTTPCGPVVTVDVAQDLSAIKVVDRTPGCDAAGVPYALVLRVKGSVPAAEDIAVDWERR